MRVVLAGLALCVLLGGCADAGHEVTTPGPPGPVDSASAATLSPTPYSARLAAVVRSRGFDLSHRATTAGRSFVAVTTAVSAAQDFRPPGTPVAVHLARVWTPGFGSLDFASRSHASDHVFDHAPAWVVVYHGEENDTPGVWVVFVDAVTGEAKAMVGFGAGLRGGAPCPNGRCIFE